MDGHNQIPVLVGHVLERDISQDTGIVEQDINAAIVLDGGLDDLVTLLDAVVVGDGFAACGSDLVDNDICGLGPSAIADSMEKIDRRHTFVELPSPLNDPPRSLTTTLAPREPKNRQYVLPRPAPPPVTTTTCPSNRSCSAIVIVLWKKEACGEKGEME
jgi:hypothetical protein